MALIKPRGTAAATTGRTSARGAGFSFAYKPRTAEEVRERASRAVGGREGVWKPGTKMFTPRQGLNTVRILPPPPQATWGHYGMTVVQHRDIGVDQSSFLCVHSMRGEACAVCEERVTASATGTEEALVKSLRQQTNVGIYVIDRAQEQEGPQLWVISGKRDQSILKLAIDPSTGEVLLVDHPDEGYDFSFTRKGQGLKTEYEGELFGRRSVPLSDDAKTGNAWLKHITDNPIDSLLVWHDYDHVKAVLEGQAPPKPAEEEKQPEQPAASTAQPSRIIPKRGAAAAPAPEPEPAGDAEELPTWDEIMGADEAGLEALVAAFDLDPATGPEFTSERMLAEWIAEQLSIAAPAPEPAAAASGKPDWRAKLRAKQG